MVASVIKSGGQPGGRRRKRGRAAPMAEINITPMVDGMLVLVIIFMVAAPLLTGKDLIDSGLQPGPLFGRILDELEQAQVAGEVVDRQQALALVSDVLSRENSE